MSLITRGDHGLIAGVLKGNRQKILLSAALLAFTPGVQAFVSYVNTAGLPQKWALAVPNPFVHPNVVNPLTRAIRYYLAADAFSAANRVAELNAARACFDQWQAVPGTILRFEEAGTMTGSVDVNTSDNTNVVYWAKTSTLVNGGLDNISGTTGVTFSDFFSDSTLAEADIVLNGAASGGYTWFTDFNQTANQGQFVEAVLLHEIGHFIGLAHTPAGAATMYPRGGSGVSVQATLSSDEIAAVRTLYPSAATPPTVARLSGLVSLGASPVLGAIVSAEDPAGNLVSGTVTRSNGRYELTGLPPGNYQVRVSPVDPSGLTYFLFRGPDIADPFVTAEPNFLPSSNTSVSLAAGGNVTQNFSVTSGTPAFRINRLWPPTADPTVLVVVNYPVAVPVGASDVALGVYCSDLLGPDPVLRVTGNGLTFGPTSFKTDAFPGLNPPLHLVSVSMHIGPEATPGMRSLVLQQGNSVAYANGFIEIPPAFPDANYDGLDDRFQRQFFARWTAPEASPAADLDHDGFDNTAEYIAGSNPANAQSVLTVESVRVDTAGATVTWPSAPGKRYQVLSRPKINSIRGWQAVGAPVLSSGDKTQFLDTTPSAGLQFLPHSGGPLMTLSQNS